MERDITAIYKEEYNKLNELQKQAVDTVEGPVMVIAGPGTGKTQILSRRIANILLNYDTKPEDIVCLTYTESGALEMLDRIEKLVGESARNVRVSTIHAFCSNLILENAEEFGNRPKIITDVMKYRLLKEAMDEYGEQGALREELYKLSGERYSAGGKVLNLLSKMKRERLDSQSIKKEIEEYFKDIELSQPEEKLYKDFKYQTKRKENNPGDLKIKKVEEEREKLNKLLAGAEIVDNYQKKITSENYFDFDDMLQWVIDKLEEDKVFQQKISSRIKYLFVDEFQDTSVIQNQLIDLLVEGKDNPNIFVVGDDDQSIYRFQGVSADNVQQFIKKYNLDEKSIITLEENYRSSQMILDSAKKLISRNSNRKNKTLVAAGENKYYSKSEPILTIYETEEQEMLGTMNKIEKLLAQGIEPSEIGVIFPRRSYGKKFAELLKNQGIFFYMKEDGDLLSESFCKKILEILKYISQPARSINQLKNLLYFDFFDVTVDDIFEIRSIKSDEKISNKKINEIDKKLNNLRYKVNKRNKYYSPISIFKDVMKVLEIDKYVFSSPDKFHLISVWRALYNLIESEVLMYPELTLKKLLIRLNDYKEMKVSLNIESIAGIATNCIQLMTTHRSKGLEFEYVFMMKCNDGLKKGSKWPGSKSHKSNFHYPPALSNQSDNEEKLEKEENIRLFYVGMTRAKKELYFSCVHNDNKRKTHLLNDCINEEKVNNVVFKLTTNSKPTVDKLSFQNLKDILSDLTLSASTLNSFLKCPLSFYFNKALKLETESNESLVFGNIIHQTLENLYIFDEGKSHEFTYKTVISKEEALEVFKKVFDKESGKLPTDRARKDDYVRGINIIEDFYRNPNYIKDGIIAIETNIKDIKLGDIEGSTIDLSEVADVKLTGRIDKIEIDNNIVRIIDYKTSKPDSKYTESSLKSPDENNPLGGDYWRQAVMYYLLLINDKPEIKDKEIIIQYIFLDIPENFTGNAEVEIKISQKDVDHLLKQMVYCIQKIKVGDFTSGNDHSNDQYTCEHCSRELLNTKPQFDNRMAIEVATFEKTRNNFKSLSVSTLNRFIDCPKSFYFDNILQLSNVAGLSTATKERVVRVNHEPTGPVFGTIMHETMEKIYKNNLDLNEAISVFEDALSHHKYKIIDTMAPDKLEKYGRNLLKNLFDDYIPNSCKNVELEKHIHVTLEDNYSINGIIDKIEFDGDVIRIVDYKTGFSQYGVEELKVGGHYWRQAAFYKLLVLKSSEINTNHKKIEIQYIFLDDDTTDKKYSLHTIMITEEDLKTVENQINEFWNTMRQGNFICEFKKEDCDFCNLGNLVDFVQLKKEVENIKN